MESIANTVNEVDGEHSNTIPVAALLTRGTGDVTRVEGKTRQAVLILPD